MAPGHRPAPNEFGTRARRSRTSKGRSFDENDHEKYKVRRSPRQRQADDGGPQVAYCDRCTSTQWLSAPATRTRNREVLLTPRRKVHAESPPFDNTPELKGKRRQKQRTRQTDCFSPPHSPCMRSHASSQRYAYLRDDVDNDLNIDFLRPNYFKMAGCSESVECNRRATCCSCRSRPSRSCCSPEAEPEKTQDVPCSSPYEYYNHKSFQNPRSSVYGDNLYSQTVTPPQPTDMQRIRYDLDCLAQDIERLSNDICGPLLNAMRVIEQTKGNTNNPTCCWCHSNV